VQISQRQGRAWGTKRKDPAIDAGRGIVIYPSAGIAFLTDIGHPLFISPDASIGPPTSPILSPLMMFVPSEHDRIKVWPIRGGIVISATRERGLQSNDHLI
jgi:hypothetical protein